MKYLGICWQCDSCANITKTKPWTCPACGKEVCDYCFARFLLCEDCSGDRTDEECKKLTGIDWDEDKGEAGWM